MNFSEFAALMLSVGVPVGLSAKILTDRLLLNPYPKEAWGGFITVGWVAGSLVVLFQFIVGMHAYEDAFEGSFLGAGLPTIVYAFVLLSLIHRLLPEYGSNNEKGFLYQNFSEKYRFLYFHVVLLALIPFIMCKLVFEEELISPIQITRVALAILALVGIVVPVSKKWYHGGVVPVGLALIVALVTLYQLKIKLNY